MTPSPLSSQISLSEFVGSSRGRRLLKETTRSLAYPAAQAARGVLRCTPCEFSCPCTSGGVSSQFRDRTLGEIVPIGVLLFLLGVAVGSLVCGGKNRIVEVSYPRGSRRVGVSERWNVEAASRRGFVIVVARAVVGSGPFREELAQSRRRPFPRKDNQL